MADNSDPASWGFITSLISSLSVRRQILCGHSVKFRCNCNCYIGWYRVLTITDLFSY